MKFKLLVMCLVAVFIVGANTTANAKMREFGFGARGVAMGQAQVAASNDFSAAYYNPANLVAARNYWGMGVLDPYVQFNQGGTSHHLYLNDVDQNERYTPSVTTGFILPVTKRLVVGGHIFITTDALLSIDMFFGPTFERYIPQHTFGLTTGFGFQVTDKLYLGYTIQSNLAFNSSTLNINLMPLLNNLLGMDVGEGTVNLNPAFELDILMTRSYKAGITYKALDWLTLGLVYKHTNPSPVNIPVHVAAGGLLPDIDILAEQKDVDPIEVTGGIAVYPIEGLVLTMDLTRAYYSNESNQEGLALLSDNPEFNQEYPTTKLDDVWIQKYGVEWKDNFHGKFERMDYAIRAGYQYYPSPYPPLNSPENTSGTVDNDAHFYTGGLAVGYKPYQGSVRKGPAYIQLEYWYEYIHLVEREHRNVAANPAVIVSKGHVVYNGLALSMHW